MKTIRYKDPLLAYTGRIDWDRLTYLSVTPSRPLGNCQCDACESMRKIGLIVVIGLPDFGEIARTPMHYNSPEEEVLFNIGMKYYVHD